MDKIDLNELERLAKAATPGPWYCTRTIQEELGLEPHDWGHIMLKPREGESWPIVLAKMNMWFATEEEQRAERTRYFCGQGKKETRDPGQPGRDAEFIVAACNAVPELIARIRELERQRELLARNLAETPWCLACQIKICSNGGKNIDPLLVDRNECKNVLICWAEQAAKEAGDETSNR